MLELVHWPYVVNSLVFSTIGVLFFIVAFIVVDFLTPYKLSKEIVQEKNVAVAIFASSVIIGLAMIIASSIHG